MFLPRVCQQRDSGTSTIVSVPFALIVIRIPLVCCQMYPSRAVHQAHQFDHYSHLSTTIVSLRPNTNVCVAPANKGKIVARVRTRRRNYFHTKLVYFLFPPPPQTLFNCTGVDPLLRKQHLTVFCFVCHCLQFCRLISNSVAFLLL